MEEQGQTDVAPLFLDQSGVGKLTQTTQTAAQTDRETEETDLQESRGKTEGRTTASGRSAGATRYCQQRAGALCPLCEGWGRLPTTPTGDSPACPPESYTGLRYQALPGVKRKTEKSLLAVDDSPDRSSHGAGGRSRTSPEMLCPSCEISQ